MNIVLYARYSSDNQREESIEGQLRECKAYAEHNDMTVVGTYIDRAISAKTDERPQFQKMIKDSNTHKFEAVLVWKLDRFSRNRYDSAHYKRILKNNGVRVISATEPISNTPESILLESLLEGLAEYYSVELAEKVSRGHTENALKLKFNGGPVPLGYVIDGERHYQIDPPKAAVVREAFERYADGETVKTLYQDFNARGLRTSVGKPFTKSSFQNMLKNRRYLGEYRYRDIVTPNAFPAIIDADLFDRVQRRCEKNKKAPAHTKTDANFILTTKAFCGKCGAMVVGESGKSKTGAWHYYYKCGNHKRNGSAACNLRAVRKEPLERWVVQKALEIIDNDAVAERLTVLLLDYANRENTRLPVLQAELKDVQKRLDNMVAAIEQGIITDTTKRRMDELENRRRALEVSIAQEQIEHPAITAEMIRCWFDHFRHGDAADPKFCQQVVDNLVNSVYIFEDKIVLNLNYTENGEPVTLSEVKSSILGEMGSPSKSFQILT